MPDASAAIPLWIILSSGSAYLVLFILIVACVLAISINQNRLEEMGFVEQTRLRNVERTALLGNTDALSKEASDLRQQFYDLSYDRLYGKKTARENPKRWADRLHANSDTMNLMIIGMCACPIGLCTGRLLTAIRIRDEHRATLTEIFRSVSIFDVFLGLLAGLLAIFVIKSGANVLSKTEIFAKTGALDASNPYGVAFVAAVVGLFMDRFFSGLEPLLGSLPK